MQIYRKTQDSKNFIALFVVFFSALWFRLIAANRENWEFRDDSVIHLSHARNFVQFGSIGLSPGDKTEALSSPLNYALSQIWFFIQPETSYQGYLNTYTILVLLIFSGSLTFLLKAISESLSERRQILLWTVSLPTVLLIVSSWTTFGWIISGMENGLAAAMLLIICGIAIKGKKTNSVHLQAIIFLAGIARIEFAVLLLPLFVLAVLSSDPNFRKPRAFVIKVSPIVCGWVIIHTFRFLYFGQLAPNTAQALGKSASLALALFLACQFFLLSASLGVRLKKTKWLDRAALIIMMISGVNLFIHSSKNGNFHLKVYLLVAAAIFLIAILHNKIAKLGIQKRLVFVIAVSALDEYFLFGPARLSEFRIVSIFVPVIILLVFQQIASFVFVSKKLMNHFVLATLVLGVLVSSLAIARVDPERDLCCKISPSENLILNQVTQFLELNNFSDSTMPISASPDLGKISFSKKVMVVDLGLIGDPVLSMLSLKNPEAVSSYLLNFATPDLFESHGYWSCRYSEFINSSEFQDQYVIKYQGFVSNEFNNIDQMNCPEQGRYTIWARNLPIVEKEFEKALSSASNNNYAQLVRKEIRKCSDAQGDVSRCEYVYRSIQRQLKGIIETAQLPGVVLALKGSPTVELDSERLFKRRDWAAATEQQITRLTNSRR
jgi:hypothetical protein